MHKATFNTKVIYYSETSLLRINASRTRNNKESTISCKRFEAQDTLWFTGDDRAINDMNSGELREYLAAQQKRTHTVHFPRRDPLLRLFSLLRYSTISGNNVVGLRRRVMTTTRVAKIK